MFGNIDHRAIPFALKLVAEVCTPFRCPLQLEIVVFCVLKNSYCFCK